MDFGTIFIKNRECKLILGHISLKYGPKIEAANRFWDIFRKNEGCKQNLGQVSFKRWLQMDAAN